MPLLMQTLQEQIDIGSNSQKKNKKSKKNGSIFGSDNRLCGENLGVKIGAEQQISSADVCDVV